VTRSSAAKQRPGAAEWVPERRTLKALRDSAQKCRGCELYADATQAVVGDGPTDAELILLGEQPGDQEDRQGKPFVGPAGRLLGKALDAADIDPERVFRTNAVKHFRFTGTETKRRMHRSPDLTHMRACRPWLDAELEIVQPRGVVLLGATAGKAVYGSGFRVTKQRGKLLDWPTKDAQEGDSKPSPDWALATIHPSAVLRADERDDAFAGLVQDLVVAQQALTSH
jgi:uracil-DNA glycosylase family protein